MNGVRMALTSQNSPECKRQRSPATRLLAAFAVATATVTSFHACCGTPGALALTASAGARGAAVPFSAFAGSSVAAFASSKSVRPLKRRASSRRIRQGQAASIISATAVDGEGVEVPAAASATSASTSAGPTAAQQIAEFIGQTDSDPSSSSSSPANQSNQQSNGDYSFFDEASVYVRAGSGGQGSSTYKKAKKSQNGIPDGGSGGTGGDVVLVVDPSLNTLAGLSRRALRPNAFGGGGAAASSKRLGHVPGAGSAGGASRERLLSFRAEDGKPGGRMYDNGRCGEDCHVRVPPGTVVSVEEEKVQDGWQDGQDGNGQVVKDGASQPVPAGQDGEDVPAEVQYDLRELGTLTHDEPSLTVARGGTGGEGTATLKGKKGSNKTRRGPTGGERHRLRLTLKIVADIALVGVPNAGKSTFLASVTRATPRIADYPFTTVVPNLGTWIPGDHGQHRGGGEAGRRENGRGGEQDRAAGSAGLVLCDVPGLIAGAADGVGLGHAFLRHVERCRVILHLVDATADDPVGDYRMVNEEIRRYGAATSTGSSLADMPQVVVVNKIDRAWEGLGEEEAEERRKDLEVGLKEAMGHTRLMWVSAKEREGVDDLMTRMASYLEKVKEAN